VSENLDFLSINHRKWFFDLSSPANDAEFTFFVLRYTFTLVAFGLGIRAPGISRTLHYLQRQDEEVSGCVGRLNQVLGTKCGSISSGAFLGLPLGGE